MFKMENLRMYYITTAVSIFHWKYLLIVGGCKSKCFLWYYYISLYGDLLTMH